MNAGRVGRVLVTGAGGFVGRVLGPALRAAGHEVIALVRRAPPDASSTGHVVADLTDAAAVERAVVVARPDAVVHLAAMTHLPDVMRDQVGALAINVQGTLNLTTALKAHAPRAHLIQVSSAAVYGSPGPSALPLDEDTPTRAEHPYGVQKIAGECLARAHGVMTGAAVTILRPFNHLGAGQAARFAASYFAESLAHMEAGLVPPVLRVGNLEARREVLDVADVVRAYVTVVAQQPVGVFNIARGSSVRIGDILERFLRAVKVKVAVESDPAMFRPFDAPDLHGSGERLAAATGFRVSIPAEDTLDLLFADARARVRGSIT